MSTMTADTIAKLEALKNYRTLYEAVLVGPAGERFMVGWASVKSKTRLLALIRDCGPRILAVIGLDESARVQWNAGAFDLDKGWSVRWTGRTQREAITHGKLPYLPTLPA